MKKLYPELHNEVFGKGWQDHSIGTSSKFVRFSLNPTKWAVITDKSLLRWLKLHRWASLSFLGYFLVFAMFFVINAIRLS